MPWPRRPLRDPKASDKLNWEPLSESLPHIRLQAMKKSNQLFSTGCIQSTHFPIRDILFPPISQMRKLSLMEVNHLLKAKELVSGKARIRT